ncbi:DHA2 family efflux MFS transporter permease subunit [Methylolobus aquaticus]
MLHESLHRLRGWRFIAFNLCLGFAHVLVIFNAGAYIAMLPRVAGGLSIPPSFATWTQTDYMVALALAYPLGGWLARAGSPRRVVVGALLGFAVCSWLCARADALYPYLLARIGLGLCGGLSLQAGQSLLLDEYPAARKSLGISVWSFFTLMPFSVGPPVGGWIADTLGWRWLFWLNLPVALIAAAGIALLLRGRPVARAARSPFDWVGCALCSVVWLGLQTLLNQGNDRDWLASHALQATGFVVAAAACLWVVHAWHAPHPYVNLRLLANRDFAIGAGALFFGFLSLQGLLSALIVQLQLNLGYSSWLAGLVFLPTALCAKPVAAVMHLAVRRVDARLLASLSLCGFATCYLWLSRFDDAASFAALLWPKVLEGACLGAFFVPLTTLMLQGLPAERHGAALELANLMRIASGAIGISLQGVVLYRRTPFHLQRWAEARDRWDGATAPMLDAFVMLGFDEAQAGARLIRFAARQAAIRALNDGFWLAGGICLVLAVAVWFAHPPVRAVAESRAAALRRDRDEVTAEEVV